MRRLAMREKVIISLKRYDEFKKLEKEVVSKEKFNEMLREFSEESVVKNEMIKRREITIDALQSEISYHRITNIVRNSNCFSLFFKKLFGLL